MSLARFALRLSAVEALRGRTMVGDNVRDSDFSAIDIGADGALRTDQDRPFILVYTDDSDAAEAGTRDLHENGELDFVCEFGIASAMTELDDETGEARVVGVNIPATDESFEIVLDLIDRQIVTALTGSGDWAELWRKVSDSIGKIERRRSSTSDEGVRLAARQLRVTLMAKSDPVAGQPLANTSVWARFRDAATAARPELADMIGMMIGEPSDEVTYDMIRASRGHTEGEGQALRYGPLYPGHEDYRIETTELDDGTSA